MLTLPRPTDLKESCFPTNVKRGLLRLFRIHLDQISPTGPAHATTTYLDRLVRPARNEPCTGHIKRGAKHARFSFERPRLWYVVHVLKRRAGVIIPERERSVIGCMSLVRRSVPKGVHIPPEKNTPSALTERVFIIALCPAKLKTKLPSGHFHFLILLPPAEPEANEYSVG